MGEEQIPPGALFLQGLESGAHTALQLAQFIVCNLALKKKSQNGTIQPDLNCPKMPYSSYTNNQTSNMFEYAARQISWYVWTD